MWHLICFQFHSHSIHTLNASIRKILWAPSKTRSLGAGSPLLPLSADMRVIGLPRSRILQLGWHCVTFAVAGECGVTLTAFVGTWVFSGIQSWKFAKGYSILVPGSAYVFDFYGCFLKWWYPQNTPKWSFLVGKPMVVGHHHLGNPHIPKQQRSGGSRFEWTTPKGLTRLVFFGPWSST